jgi:uncharacterized protein (TIGR02058 family)
MTVKTYMYEFGMGVDVHGDDATKAACRAVSDAIRHSSLSFLGEIRERGGKMLVNATIAVPNTESLDIEAIRRELPHGEITVTPVVGGLKVPNADVLMACALITVSADIPD